MKSLNLLLALLRDAERECNTSTTRDSVTVTRRLKKEGESFFTLTLPSFADDFERSLEQKMIVPTSFRGFRRVKGGSIPALLQGMTEQVFNRQTGLLLEKPSIDCIFYVRLICRIMKKVRLECSPEKVRKAVEGYQEIERIHSENPYQRDEQYVRYAKSLWTKVLSGFLLDMDSVEDFFSGVRHGPGVVVDREDQHQKYIWKHWYHRLQQVIPYQEVCWYSPAVALEMSDLPLLSPEQEQPVKVTLVPKTLKGPRVIAIEPKCMQYAQQALCKWLVSKLESHPITRKHIRFTDQLHNRLEALSSSSSGDLATLDMKDASDRVSLELVRETFSGIPGFLELLESTRSTRAKLPSGEVIPLKKFASMGSALCFPVESMVFFTVLCYANYREELRTNRYRKPVFKISDCESTSIYGDDIIIPVSRVLPAIERLEYFNLKVNSQKSFWNGKFRESCGLDAYDGIDVTCVYVRRPWPSGRQQASEIVSWVSTANQLYLNNCYAAAYEIQRNMENEFRLNLPCVDQTQIHAGSYSAVSELDIANDRYLCWCFGISNAKTRYNSKLYRPEVLALVPTVRKKVSVIDGYEALTKYFITKPRKEIRSNYSSVVGRDTLTLKSRWLPL
jgi:hypothetical protein